MARLTKTTLKYMGAEKVTNAAQGYDQNGFSETAKDELGSYIDDTIQMLQAYKDGGQSEFLSDGLEEVRDETKAYQTEAMFKVPEMGEVSGYLEDARKDLDLALKLLAKIRDKYVVD